MIEAFQTMTAQDLINIMWFLFAGAITALGWWTYNKYKKEEL